MDWCNVTCQANLRKLWLTYSCNGGEDLSKIYSTKICRYTNKKELQVLLRVDTRVWHFLFRHQNVTQWWWAPHLTQKVGWGNWLVLSNGYIWGNGLSGPDVNYHNNYYILMLLAPMVLLEDLWPMITIPSIHPSHPTYSSEWTKQA